MEFTKRKLYDTAISNWEKAVDLNKYDADYLYKLALIYFERKQYSDSILQLEKALDICPIHFRAYLLLGINWLKLRKIQKAEKYVYEANQLNRGNILTYLNLGAIYSINKRYNDAIELFNKCIKLAPKEARAYLGLARIYAMLNDIEAYFIESQCGANCDDAKVFWIYEGFQYMVGLKGGKQADVLNLANATIENSIP